MLNFIVNTDADDVAQLFVGYDETTTRSPRDNIRNDRVMAFSVEPVTMNPPGDSTIFDADYEATDTFILTVGPIDEPPTGGTFSLDVGGTTTNLTGLSPTITAANLQTPLSAAFVTEGESACTVTDIGTTNGCRAFQIDATTNGAIPTGILTGTSTQLIPACEIQVTEVELGDASTPYQLILVIRQAAIATATPSTALTTAGVTATTTQAQTATANKIVTVSMDAARTYGGTFSVSATVDGVTQTCGVATPTMSAGEFATVLAGHPNIYFQATDGTADNISVTKNGSSFIVEFTGTQGAAATTKTITDATVANPTVLTVASTSGWVSGQTVAITNSTGITPSLNGSHTITVINATTFSIPVNVTVASGESATAVNTTQPALTVANIDLLAPLGRSGTINFNTVNLYKLSLAQSTDSFTMPMQIERTRASGEVRQIFLGEVTLKKDIINTSTMVALPGSPFRVDAMVIVDAAFGSDSTGTRERFDLPFATLSAARAAAASGDLVLVRPNSWTITGNLLKNGVNWDFTGSTVTLTGSSASGIWDDTSNGANGACTSIIYGGSFTFFGPRSSPFTQFTCGVVNLTNSGSNVRFIDCVNMLDTDTTGDDSTGFSAVVTHFAGTLSIDVGDIIGTEVSGIYWEDGQEDINANLIESTNWGAVYGIGAASPVGDMNIRAHRIFGNHATNGTGVSFNVISGTAATCWITCDEIQGGAIPISCEGGKLYINAQKVGRTSTGVGVDAAIQSSGGTLWATIQKVAGGGIRAGGNIRILGNPDLDDDLGATDNIIEILTGAVAELYLGRWKTVTAAGMLISGGTARVHGTLDTSAITNAAVITKSGGTLIIYSDAVLVAHSGGKSIDAASAQNVVNYGYWTNYAKDADITLLVVSTENVSTSVA